MLERSRSLVVAAWATLISQIMIVGTGGAVRLTGSGLGCDSWPNCTPERFVPTPEMGIHSAIEFGNRVLGGIVVLIALVMLVMAIRQRAGRAIVTIAALVFGITVLQALMGAVVVWMHLRPDTVGLHFILSVALVAMAAVMLWKVQVGPSGPATAPGWQRILVLAMTAALAVVVLIGILTTGSGPHAGDGGAARNGLDPAVMQHVHAIPAYVLTLLVLGVLAAAAIRGPRRHLLWSAALLAVTVAQAVVGIVQSNTGLPILLVGIHMVLSVIATAIAAAVVLSLRPSLRAPLRGPDEADAPRPAEREAVAA